MPYNMEAYGDSAGAGASDQCATTPAGVVECYGYNKRIREALELKSGIPVTLDNDSVGGYRISSVYNTMLSDTAAIQQADLITWDGGGNDWRVTRNRLKDGLCDSTCLNNTLNNFKLYWDAIVNLVANNKKPNAVVKAQTYFYPYVIEDKKDNTYNKLASLLLNMDAHAKQATEAKGFHYIELIPTFNVSLYTPTDPRTLGLTYAGDELHPNTEGHKKIAELHIAKGFGTL